MDRDGHVAGEAIGQHYAAAGETDLHDAAREIASRMRHCLVHGRNVAIGGVIVSSEMSPAATASCGLDQLWNGRVAVGSNDRLRGLDHEFDWNGPGRKMRARLELVQKIGEDADLCGRCDFGQRHDKAGGQPAASPVEQCRNKELKGADATDAESLGERLDADPEIGRKVRFTDRCRYFLRGCDGVGVFLTIGPITVAVLEIETVVLDRLGLELSDYA